MKRTNNRLCVWKVQEKKGMVVFFQAEDGIRDLVRSRGLGDVYKRQVFAVTGKSEE